MKRIIAIVMLFLFSLAAAGCVPAKRTTPTIPTTSGTTVPVTETVFQTIPTEPETVPPTTLPEPVYTFTEEEREMLLKIGMAELGSGTCTECVALVMRTILNRVEADRFGNSIRSVLFAQDQFTPVMDGSYYQAEPNDRCLEALDMIIYGWDESQGALYYEWCEGESWHSKNLHLLFQHCDVRFYD